MDELAPGLWHWQAPHPDWRPSEPWDRNVSSYAIDDGERLLLFDPLGVPTELEERAASRETAIVISVVTTTLGRGGAELDEIPG